MSATSTTQSFERDEADFETQVREFAHPERLERLRGRLAERGSDHLDVQWFTHATPVGDLMVCSGAGRIVRLAFAREDFDAVQDELARSIGTRTLRSDRKLEFVRNQLDEYFDGRRHVFDVPVDFRLSTGEFRRAVQAQLPTIGYGTTVTYRELATAAGRPAAVRAAATACATNPVPIIIPCHRVIRSDGTTGAYLGGAESKKWLLRHEDALSER